MVCITSQRFRPRTLNPGVSGTPGSVSWHPRHLRNHGTSACFILCEPTSNNRVSHPTSPISYYSSIRIHIWDLIHAAEPAGVYPTRPRCDFQHVNTIRYISTHTIQSAVPVLHVRARLVDCQTGQCACTFAQLSIHNNHIHSCGDPSMRR